jgi:hypothetical protein
VLYLDAAHRGVRREDGRAVSDSVALLILGFSALAAPAYVALTVAAVSVAIVAIFAAGSGGICVGESRNLTGKGAPLGARRRRHQLER